MRKRLTEQEKKPSFGLSIDPELLEKVQEHCNKNDIKISQFIEEIIREHYNDEKLNTNK